MCEDSISILEGAPQLCGWIGERQVGDIWNALMDATKNGLTQSNGSRDG